MGKKKKDKKDKIKKLRKLYLKIKGAVEEEVFNMDVNKFLKGTNTSGTKINKRTMEIQKLCKSVREEVSRLRKKRAESK